LVWEPQSGFLLAVNGDSGSLVIIDTKTAAVVDTIPIGGKLEFAASDGKGLVYVNIETKNAIAVVDIQKRKVIREVRLAGCEEPSGLAYDATDGLLLSVCANGLLKVIKAESAVEVASLTVGKGSDAVLYDPIRHVAFSTGGDDGTLSVIAVRGVRDIRVVQTLQTAPGARLGAIDPTTGQLYIPAVQYDRTLPPVKLPGLPPLPAAIPDSFKFLIFAPRP
jgi:YVTN family beta-propeller protein